MSAEQGEHQKDLNARPKSVGTNQWQLVQVSPPFTCLLTVSFAPLAYFKLNIKPPTLNLFNAASFLPDFVRPLRFSTTMCIHISSEVIAIRC